MTVIILYESFITSEAIDRLVSLKEWFNWYLRGFVTRSIGKFDKD